MEENVPHPLGVENLGSKEDLIDAIAQMRAKKAFDQASSGKA